jgi:soluble lytic murein transglycosylase-like protein
LNLVLAAYNAGEGTVDGPLRNRQVYQQIMQANHHETKNYVPNR